MDIYRNVYERLDALPTEERIVLLMEILPPQELFTRTDGFPCLIRAFGLRIFETASMLSEAGIPDDDPRTEVFRILRGDPGSCRVSNMKTKKMRLVNLTPHNINLGRSVSVPPADKLARIVKERRIVETVNLDASGEEVIEAYELSNPRIIGLPKPEDGTIYIVSPMVRIALSLMGVDRPDVMSPYLIETVEIEGRRQQCARALAR